ncbi:hypothetical protein Q5M47_13105 [Acinetobacter nosocomialis]|nr:hypothetical protein [Acinetobacter nosocomialis]MDO7216333.1 hypothetical protein [Acinetobacter nosocomialis]
MKDKPLQEKIKSLLFWTLIFFILYIIVAYLLDSLWLQNTIGFQKAYEIIKDGLSITAAFLAPASAFLLFSNWREQYNAQFIDKTLIDLMIQLKDMDILLNRKGYDLNDNAFNNILKSTNEIRFELEHIKLVLKIYPNYISEEFINDIIQFKDLSKEIDDLIAILSRMNQENSRDTDDNRFFASFNGKNQKLDELSEVKKKLEDKITAIRLILLNKT